MKKLILFYVIFPMLLIDFLLASLGYWFYTVWVVWYQTLRGVWMQFWVVIPEEVRKEFPTFDSNGLLHHIDHLNSINKRELLNQPLEAQAAYVDLICYQQIKNLSADDCGQQLEFLKKGYGTAENCGKMFNAWNATDIGNFAYMAIHHPDTEVADKCKEILLQCKNHFNSFQ
jgi:hypothetical protein